MPYDLANLRLSEMTELGIALRGLGAGAQSKEQIANQVVDILHNEFVDPNTRAPVCALARFYLTTEYANLDDRLRAIADQSMNERLAADTRCLTLLATSGEEPVWRSRTTSVSHQVVPLPNKQVVQSIPMISQLMTQLGIDLGMVVAPKPSLVLELEQRSYNVFFVPDAIGSPVYPCPKPVCSSLRYSVSARFWRAVAFRRCVRCSNVHKSLSWQGSSGHVPQRGDESQTLASCGHGAPDI
jgi:two-component system, NtrC family, sensor kinase